MIGMLEQLFEAACVARDHAYAPYSKFQVGAALLSAEGKVFTGCNVENAAYPVGTCAEAGAIAAMALAGERRFTDIVIVGKSEAGLVPCGACRQRLFEFGGFGARIHAAGSSGITKTITMQRLLPEAFGPDSLLDVEPMEKSHEHE